MKHHMQMKVICHNLTDWTNRRDEKRLKQDLNLHLGQAFILE